MTHTPSNILQYNEYYPFGLQTNASRTRDGSKNNFLYNAGNELNATSGWYETYFRGYDAALGKFLQVDPMADKYGSWSPYNYAFNDPVYWNDPMGADPNDDEEGEKKTEHEDAHPGMSNEDIFGNAFDRAEAFMDALNGAYSEGYNYLVYGSAGGVGGSAGPNGFGSGSMPGAYFGSGRAGMFYDVYEVWMEYYVKENGNYIDSEFLGYRFRLKDRGPNKENAQQDGISSDFDFVGATSRFLGSLGILGGSADMGLGKWVGERPAKLLNGTAKLHPRFMDLNDKAFVYANKFLSGAKTIKLLNIAKVTGIGATVAGVVVSGAKIATGKGDAWDVADIGVNLVGLGATFFLASNPIGWTIGGAVLLYNGTRLAYDLLKD